MPAFNLTKDLYEKSKLNNSLILSLKGKSKDEVTLHSELCDLTEILEAENAKDQIDLLKKVLVSIKKHSECLPVTDTGLLLALQYLVHLFFVATSKNPVRRVLISYFQGLSASVQQHVIKPSIESELAKLLNQSVRKQNLKSPIRFEESNIHRHDVDTLSGLLGNFPLGEDCLKSCCLLALNYLCQLQKHFYLTYSYDLSPVQQNETMHNCLETTKLANRICQRSSTAMEAKVKDKEGIKEIRNVSDQLIQIDIRILKSDEFLIDCRTTSSMNVALWMKTLYAEEDNFIIKQLLLTVFQKVVPCDFDLFPDRLETFDLSQLEKSLLSDSSYLCLCYGILAIMSVETLLIKFDNKRCLLLDVLLPEFLELNKRCRDVGNKMLATKSICLLTQKLSQYIKNNRANCGIELLSRLNGESPDMSQILDYVWTSWEDSLDAVRFTVKETFQHVVSIHLNSLESGVVTSDDKFLQKLTKSIITDVSWSCKGKYGTLSVLVGHLGSTRMLQLHPGIAADVLLQLREQTLACYASDLYEKLFLHHMTELSSCASDWLTLWQPCWTDSVLEVLCGSNKLQKKHVIEYILPKLLKTGSPTLQHIVSKLSSGSLGDKIVNSIKGQQLGAMIICLRRARALGQLQGLPNRAERRKKKEEKHSKTKHAGTNISSAVSEKVGKDQSDPELVNRAVASNAGLSQADPKASDQSIASEAGISQSDLWYGIVNVKVLRQALNSRDEQVRLDAFALLCENQKTTEVVSDLELHLIRDFIPYNLNNQMPSFRQHFLSHLKKLLSRMKESQAVLKRNFISKKDTDAASTLMKYKEFLVWLKQCFSSGLFPGSVFARRTTCLGGVSLLMDIYSDIQTNRAAGQTLGEEFKFFNELDKCDTEKLLHCLTDTFEDNKNEAARILISCSTAGQGILDAKETENLFHVALALSSSTRPQDSTTAAYIFKVLIHQPAIFEILNNHKTSLNRKRIENEKEAFTQKESNIQIQALTTKNEDISQEIRGHKIESTQNIVSSESLKDSKEDILKSTIIEDDILGRRFLLLVILLKSLQEQADIAKNNLIVAAANCPLYPTMQCMRYCLAYINFRVIPERHHTMWKWFLSEFISLCLKISGVVSPVVHNSSPEGNIPVESVQATGLSMADCSVVQSEEKVSRSQEAVMLMPEYLVVCCWRSVKEISLILGQLTNDVAVSDDKHSVDGLLTHQQVLEIGSYFTTQLLESKHRGAFELAYAGFVKVTEMLWRSSIKDLHNLPREWLQEVMKDIKSGDPDSRLCATRRSAGVPFYVQALVTTEPMSTGRLCFKQTMQELLSLAFNEAVDSEENNTSKVHALNILRAMFKDTRLGDDVTPYVADGLKVAVLGFKSSLWAVRNSATLLMSAMMVRIFGVKRSKDETSLSRKNCQTGRTFFHRYPSLYQFLLDQLAESIVTMETGESFHLHPALYPILMLLGHLFPSAMEGTDTTLNLAAFIPYVIKCSYSPVLKTRVMTARALQPLVEKDHVTGVFDDLLALLPSESFQTWKQNHIHGVLLQVRKISGHLLLPGAMTFEQSGLVWTCVAHVYAYATKLVLSYGFELKLNHGQEAFTHLVMIKQLLKLVPVLSTGCQDELRLSLVPKWMERITLLTSRKNPCLLTRKESLEISADIIYYFYPHGNDDITSHMTKILLHEIDSTDSRFEHSTPGLVDFETSICKLSLQCLGRLTEQKIINPVHHHTVLGDQESLKTKLAQQVLMKENRSSNLKGAGDFVYSCNLEMIVLKFMTSPSYEVRKGVLETIKHCLLQKQTSNSQNENVDSMGELDDCDNALSRDGEKMLYSVVKDSLKIFEELVTMAFDKEIYHGCLTEVFNALQCHPFSQGQEQLRNDSVEELLRKLIRKERSLTRDEVLTSLIGYSGHLIGHLYLEIAMLQKRRADDEITPHIDDLIQKKLTLLEEWASVIQNHCGTEQNVDKQLACVRAITDNASYLLCDSSNILGSRTFSFWKIVINLIQEDDLEVKDTAAGIIPLIDPSLKAPIHPYLGLDLLIGQLLRCHGNSKMVDCIISLIDWIVESSENNEDFEERLFDRGEMNTYREPVDFIQIVDKHLLRFLHSTINFTGDSPKPPLSFHPVLETISYQDMLANKNLGDYGRKMDLNEREILSYYLSKTLEKLKLTIASLQSINAKVAYFNASSFNRNIVDIYRIVTLLNYDSILCVNEENRTKFDSVRKMLEEVFSQNPHIEALLRALLGR